MENTQEPLSKRKPNNIYIDKVKEFGELVFQGTDLLEMPGQWSKEFANQNPIDLEIGCGNGTFFHHLTSTNPTRNFVGFEQKFKPLVQTIRRCHKEGLTNGRAVRTNANLIHLFFGPGEVENIYIFFPDPWTKQKQQKHRLLQENFFNSLYKIMKPTGNIFIKTDSLDYFNFINTQIPKNLFTISERTTDLHQSEFAAGNFITQFERIFMGQKTKINYLKCVPVTNRTP